MVPSASASSPGAKLRALLGGGTVATFLQAHDALSARIVSESGVPGIWASSLALSAVAGIPDHGLLTLTELLAAVERMTDAATVPLLVDGDQGYGDVHHVRALVQGLERRGAAGVCIEDRAFPKRNALLVPTSHALEDPAVFASRLHAASRARRDPAFVVVARTEALVTGDDVGHALERAARYVDAGADAILVHTRQPSFDPVEAFLARWNHRAPVLCVPTTYPDTDPERFARAGVAATIWANHVLRAAIHAMQRTAAEVARNGRPTGAGATLAPLSEVFRLQRVDEADAREREAVAAAARSGSRSGDVLEGR